MIKRKHIFVVFLLCIFADEVHSWTFNVTKSALTTPDPTTQRADNHRHLITFAKFRGFNASQFHGRRLVKRDRVYKKSEDDLEDNVKRLQFQLLRILLMDSLGVPPPKHPEIPSVLVNRLKKKMAKYIKEHGSTEEDKRAAIAQILHINGIS